MNQHLTEIPHHHVIIVIPAKNEAASIRQVLNDIKACFHGTILVVDDGSTDNTAELAKKEGALVIQLAFSLGAWGAMQTGLRYAEKNGYQVAITMDADGQHEANSIIVLLEALQQQSCDVMIGECVSRGSWARHVAWKLFRFLSGIDLRDLTSGLRAYNKNAIKLLSSKIATLLEYQDIGVLMLLHHANLTVKEVNIVMQPRLDGHSRIFSSWWVVGKYMLHTFILTLAFTNHIKFKK
ncbi:glycosyltransferase family 2 protein [Thioflexithrix psekupsensis]|uniref:Glycosyl transferase n=1 Tax=Thioflexithrix psekupsensis TaxID=1570016 RepID=A0A251XBZ4_9GAMM|nr:glycosyltransferase family 2 protein [Thioflexithrix psekupsensis]OUD16247.1 glycosyl transferase [Thioflexithrix psekupsensis]